MASPELHRNVVRFRQLVLEEEHLLRQLRQTGDLESFIALSVQLSREHGCPVTPEEVQAAVQDERRAWLQKWI